MRAPILAIGILTNALFCWAQPVAAQPRAEIVVAAAANLTQAFEDVGRRFEMETGIHVVFSFGATAQIASQAENGAPFDVIAAADTEHVMALERKGFLLAGSRANYAEGVLALWIPPKAAAQIRSLQELASSGVKIIALAKPELAPYGEAAVAALKKAGLWDLVQSKIVYAENINVARQYGVSGNADAVLTAAALVGKEEGFIVNVDPKLYPAIDQALGILKSSRKQAEARRLVDFLLHGEGKKILSQFGYRLPAQ